MSDRLDAIRVIVGRWRAISAPALVPGATRHAATDAMSVRTIARAARYARAVWV